MISYKGGNGTSQEEAILIDGAKDEIEGVNAEYDWLEEKFGRQNKKWEMIDQLLIDEDDRQYDLLKIRLRNGDIKEFWFDITEFFGE